MTGVDVSVTDGVGRVTISNPGKRNALSPAMLSELGAALEELRGDVRCLVVAGDGEEAFCSGFDLSAIEMDTFHEEHEPAYEETMRALGEFPYPTIAEVDGDAIGGGFDLSLSCDVRVCGEDARFGVPTAKIGIVYSDRAIRQMVRLLGPARAKELLFTGELVDADRAAGMGLVNDVAADVGDRVTDLATTIAGNAPLSLTASKQIVETVLDADRLSPTEQEYVEGLRTEAFESEDFEEGLAAVSEGREPEFRGE